MKVKCNELTFDLKNRNAEVTELRGAMAALQKEVDDLKHQMTHTKAKLFKT